MDTIVLATNNKGKIRELSVMLEPFGLTVKPLSDFPEIGDIPETGDTFLENAFIKARTVAEITGLVTVPMIQALKSMRLRDVPACIPPGTQANTATIMTTMRRCSRK